MRAEAAAPAAAPGPPSEAPGRFGPALRRAARSASGEEGEDTTPIPTAAPTAAPGRTATTPEPTSTGPTAATALATSRLAERTEVEIGAGEGMRWLLTQAPAGVEVEVRAAPALWQQARADLQAVADSLRRRGARTARVALRVEAGGRAGRAGPGRKVGGTARIRTGE